jgi:F-type H+-transporting ATPase subunit epsilon
MPGFQLEIVTPERRVYSGQVERLQAPGSEGSFGVLVRHAPFLTSLKVGQLAFAEEGGPLIKVAISGGFAEVRGDRVAVLAETAELAQEIDVARAQAARDRAQERLSRRREETIDEARARVALARALNRLKVAGSG